MTTNHGSETSRSLLRCAPLLVAVALLAAACGSTASAEVALPASSDDSAVAVEVSDTESNGVESYRVESNGVESNVVESETSEPATAVAVTTTIAPEPAAEGETAEPKKPAEPATTPVLTGGEIAPPGQTTNWTATINGDINASVWLAQEGGFLTGEIVYGAEPIQLLGRPYAGGEGFFLHEFGPDGEVSGTLIVPTIVDGIVSEATWSHPNSADASFDGPLSLELEFDGVGAEPFVLDPVVRPGGYAYGFISLPDEEICCGPRGSLVISDVTETEITIQFDNHNGGPAYNLATVPSTVIPLNENVARYSRTDDISYNCTFDITIFDGIAFVTYVDDAYECGFGNAAGVEGIYVLDEAATALVAQVLGDEVLTASSFGELKLGQSWRSLTEQYGVPAFDPEDHPFDECYYVQIPNVPNSPWLMLLGDGNDAVVSRIEPLHADHQSDANVGAGSTEAEVLAAYDGAVSSSPHVYAGEGAKYLTVDVDPGIGSTLLYETNEQGIVAAVRNGYLGPISWVEGCA